MSFISVFDERLLLSTPKDIFRQLDGGEIMFIVLLV